MSRQPSDPTGEERIRRVRDRMIAQIDHLFRETAAQTGESALEPGVRLALERVPRHAFVPESLRDRAYDDCALPIGEGQTISQPFIVALMTQLARIGPTSRVLEIGTGCGYQAAVLAEIARRVFSIERIGELAARAERTLTGLGYTEIALRTGDGARGWPEEAPFDAIVVTAAAARIPRILVEQLVPDGRLVLPLAERIGAQQLTVVTRDANDGFRARPRLPVAFVPLVLDDHGGGPAKGVG